MRLPFVDRQWRRAVGRRGAGLLLALALLVNASAAGAGDHQENAGRAPVVKPLAETFIIHKGAGPDTLMDIARRYDLGFVELRAANPGIDPWHAGEGREIVLPTLHLEPSVGADAGARRSIVVNLAEMRLYLFRGPGVPAMSFPIGIGREGWETPTGTTTIVQKRRNPTWVPPASIRARDPRLPAQVPPGPNNPLGAFALNLGWPSYVIHGTNKPDGVGRRVSHGCLRLYPEDIERLFDLVEVGTPVTIIDQPVKLAWLGDALYLEVHPSQTQAVQVELTGSFLPEPLPDLLASVERALGGRIADIDRPLVAKVAQERRGVAVRISR